MIVPCLSSFSATAIANYRLSKLYTAEDYLVHVPDTWKFKIDWTYGWGSSCFIKAGRGHNKTKQQMKNRRHHRKRQLAFHQSHSGDTESLQTLTHLCGEHPHALSLLKCDNWMWTWLQEQLHTTAHWHVPLSIMWLSIHFSKSA